MRIIVPKNFVNLNPYANLPFFYLAGPVVGGGDWQQRMCRALDLERSDSTIVVPTRWDEHHPLAAYFLPGDLGKEKHFPRQLDFEIHYLDMAAKYWSSCVVFWLGVQKEARPVELGPYGRDTYGEVGEFRGRMMHNPTLRIVIGAEENFSGLDVIERNFRKRLGSDFPFYRTMEETAAAALKKAMHL